MVHQGFKRFYGGDVCAQPPCALNSSHKFMSSCLCWEFRRGVVGRAFGEVLSGASMLIGPEGAM